jgi:signal transduction histidine kinase
VPVILTDTGKSFIIETNLDSAEYNAPGKLQILLESMSNYNDPIKVQLNENETALIFYRDSEVLTQLKYFPYIQIIIVTFFGLIAYLLFSTFRKAEQNRVWVGMAKETAHQLGTPISSLIAWLEILKSQQVDATTIQEMNKDIQRLQTITERFSKIGSEGDIKAENIEEVLTHSINYLKPRLSKNIQINLPANEFHCHALINIPLFEWVIENIIKNAVDAMEGEGKISIEIKSNKKNVIVDITDTGKGIASKNIKTVFEPGFTTKTRGWGLGLALAKRIIEYYHKGEIYVYKTEIGKGTTFRIKLLKAN